MPSPGQTSTRESDPVEVLVPRCKAESPSFVAFMDALRVELAGGRFRCCAVSDSTERIPEDPALYVRVDMGPCVADGDRVQVSVVSTLQSAGMPPIEREITLTDVVQTARPRALALAVAELIRSSAASASEFHRVPTALPAPRSPTPLPAPPAARKEPPFLVFSLKIGGEWRWLPAHDTIAWGGQTQLTAAGRSLHVDFDLGGSRAATHSELGTVVASRLSAGIGFGPRLTTPLALIDLGVRAEMGRAWITGDPAFSDVRSAAGSDLISSVGVRISSELAAEFKVRPNLAVEGGRVLRGISGEVNGQPVMGIQGWYLLSVLGGAISL